MTRKCPIKLTHCVVSLPLTIPDDSNSKRTYIQKSSQWPHPNVELPPCVLCVSVVLYNDMATN